MKYVSRFAFLGVILVPVFAKAEVATIKKKEKTAELRAFENFDRKIEAMEDYSVGYVSGDKKTYVVMKSTPARQQRKAVEMEVQLIAAQGKS